MKVTGIIAEYNPFHNGHLHQIQKIRRETDTDFIIVAMSGDFVQRGRPAIMDKYARAKMALSCGADLVVELPVIWATASAEYFATAGVRLFEQMGCVDRLCFGTETSNLKLLDQIASCLADEPSAYRELLSSFLKTGMNYPAARAAALGQYMTCEGDELSSLLSSPNNILAIEYLKALKSGTGTIVPYPIIREGNGYHSASLSGKNPSATAIRSIIEENGYHTLSPEQSGQLTDAMPAAAFEIFQEILSSSAAIHANDFSSILSYLLLSRSVEGLACVADCNEDIARRFKGNLCSFTDFTQFALLNQTRDVTGTRISRIFAHLLLGITEDTYRDVKNAGWISYIRPLGFRKSSTAVLSQIKRQGGVPMVGKLADAKRTLPESALPILQKDIFAADLYEQVLAQKRYSVARSEYTRELVILP